MTSGLGDYILMGDLMRKVEAIAQESRCLIVHRGNPHTKLWPYDNPRERFFSIYQPLEMLRMKKILRRAKKNGYIVFGLQMAPGSIQGFFLHTFLKKIRLLDFIVDFNLINADIITPPIGEYILSLHLNQIRDLLNIKIPNDFYKLKLPIKYSDVPEISADSHLIKIGLHPWSRRGHLPCFVWPFEKWAQLIEHLLSNWPCQIIVFGKDNRFDEFKSFLKERIGTLFSKILFIPSMSVEKLIVTVNSCDFLVSVNTVIVHIGYALNKKMVILSGPSLDLWLPKDDRIRIVHDEDAIFRGSDKYISDERYPSVSRIDIDLVVSEVERLLNL